MKKFIYTVLLLINSLAAFANREAGAWSEIKGDSGKGEIVFLVIMSIIAIPVCLFMFAGFISDLGDDNKKNDLSMGCMPILLIALIIFVFFRACS